MDFEKRRFSAHISHTLSHSSSATKKNLLERRKKERQERNMSGRLLKRIEQVFAFRVPPRESSMGYKYVFVNGGSFFSSSSSHIFTRSTTNRAKNWDKHVWSGSMEIVEKSDSVVYINLVDASSKLFATCPIREDSKNPVERALDSSRYFVLRIEHPETKKTVVIGIGFIDRGEAFDFQSTVADSRAKIKMEKNIAQNKVDWGPDIDFTMKDGESIDIKMPTASSVTPKDSSDSLMGSDDMDSGILAPPPQSSGGRRRRRRGRGNGSKKSSSAAGGLDDIFDASPATTTSTATTSSSSNAAADDLGDFFS